MFGVKTMKTARPRCIDLYVLVGLGWDPETAFFIKHHSWCWCWCCHHLEHPRRNTEPRRTPEPLLLNSFSPFAN